MTQALSYSGFSFAYPGGPQILQGVDWQVEQGAFALLVGNTGCGKTTLLRCAKPELAPVGQRDGQISVFGQPIEQLDVRSSAGRIGFVAQSPDNQVVCHTVWHEMAFGLENLGLPQQEMHRRVAEVCHFFGIEPWFHRTVDQLSGGQRQLLNLASVLVMQPQVLLLDEPTAQLDPVAQKNFCHALFRLNRELGLTVVVATHAPHQFQAYATQCLRLEQGNVCPVSLDEFAPRILDMPLLAQVKTTQVKAVPSLAAQDTAIVLEDVYVRYARNEEPVLRGADLTVQKGSVQVLVGGNGSGKSTLLKTCAGLLKPHRGRLANVLRDNQALLPQDPKALFVCDTVQEELMEWSQVCGYGPSEVQKWLCDVGLQEHAQQHPYDLSGGQQQLLAFAKLALTKPSLLLLDEPAKGLDPQSKLVLARSIRCLQSQGATVLLATHDLAFAACVAQSVSMLFDGQVTCTEPATDFFCHNLFYRPAADAFTDAYMQAQEGFGAEGQG